jgi:3-hydroxyisobutyrate dehydrogenase-like beta-hydroxyacid dehydrogenase
MKIGFIGLGIMGSRMAANLQKSGHSVVVYNRTREKAEPLLAEGVKWADSPASLAPEVEILFTMLAHPDAIREAALGEKGFLPRFPSGRLWVDCSTVNPSFSRAMADEARSRGIHFLDAPVTGSKEIAAGGKLVLWVGGDSQDLEACRSVLEHLGDRIVHVGGQGMGTAMKMVMNLLLGATMAVFTEGMILGESQGISRKALFDALSGSPIAAPFVMAKRKRIESGNFEDADFPLRWLQKDLHLASVSAYEAGAATPLANVAKEIYRLAMQDGNGDKDFSAIYSYLAKGAGR